MTEKGRGAPTLAIAARRLNARARKKAKALPAMFFVTDETRLADPLTVAACLPRGAGIIFRHYGAANRAALAQRLAAIARRRGLCLLIAADPALARAVRAQGVHWPEALMARACQTRRGFVTAAAHDLKALLRTRNIGLDAVFLSPVFATRSPSGRPPLGALRFAALVRASPVPVYALGGISEATARQIAGSGAAGIAAADAFR